MKQSRCTHPRLILDQRLRKKEFAVLLLVRGNAGSNRTHLARQAGLSPNTMGSYLHDLSKARLVHCTGVGRSAAWWPGAAPPPVVPIARNPMLNSVWSMAE